MEQRSLFPYRKKRTVLQLFGSSVLQFASLKDSLNVTSLRTEKPRNRRTEEPKNRGTEEPRNRRTEEPKNFGAIGATLRCLRTRSSIPLPGSHKSRYGPESRKEYSRPIAPQHFPRRRSRRAPGTLQWHRW